jgi:DNA polymerase-3 subunit delta'
VPFSDLIDQRHAKALLQAALASGRVSHAYLFVGPFSVGRLAAARAFAQALLCAEGGEDACGRCPACRKVASGAHPDLRVIAPGGRTEYGAERRAVGIEQIRELKREAAYGPYEGPRKIFIIEDAEAMRAEAANSLLKIVEEPPPGVVVVLIAESTEALLPTLVSRSQLIRFSFVPTRDIAEALVARFGLAEDRARFLATIAGGRVGTAFAAAAAGDAPFDRRHEVVETLGAVLRGDAVVRLDAAEALARQRDEIERWLDTALLWMRDVVVWQETRDDARLANLDLRREVAAWAAWADPKGLRRAASAIEAAKTDLASNLNPRIVLDTLFAGLDLGAPATGSPKRR